MSRFQIFECNSGDGTLLSLGDILRNGEALEVSVRDVYSGERIIFHLNKETSKKLRKTLKKFERGELYEN